METKMWLEKIKTTKSLRFIFQSKETLTTTLKEEDKSNEILHYSEKVSEEKTKSRLEKKGKDVSVENLEWIPVFGGTILRGIHGVWGKNLLTKKVYSTLTRKLKLYSSASGVVFYGSLYSLGENILEDGIQLEDVTSPAGIALVLSSTVGQYIHVLERIVANDEVGFDGKGRIEFELLMKGLKDWKNKLLKKI